jgi:hypothetical protein
MLHKVKQDTKLAAIECNFARKQQLSTLWKTYGLFASSHERAKWIREFMQDRISFY